MRLTITIDMDNAAFHQRDWGASAEVGRILTLFCARLEPHELMSTGTTAQLMDYNGNTVGRAVVTTS